MTYFNWKSPDIPNLNESTHLDEHGNEWMKCMVEDLSQVIFLFSQFLHMWAPIIIPVSFSSTPSFLSFSNQFKAVLFYICVLIHGIFHVVNTQQRARVNVEPTACDFLMYNRS